MDSQNAAPLRRDHLRETNPQVERPPARGEMEKPKCRFLIGRERWSSPIKLDEVSRTAFCRQRRLIARAPLTCVEMIYSRQIPGQAPAASHPAAVQPPSQIWSIFKDRERCSSQTKSNEVSRAASCRQRRLIARAPLTCVEMIWS